MFHNCHKPNDLTSHRKSRDTSEKNTSCALSPLSSCRKMGAEPRQEANDMKKKNKSEAWHGLLGRWFHFNPQEASMRRSILIVFSLLMFAGSVHAQGPAQSWDNLR